MNSNGKQYKFKEGENFDWSKIITDSFILTLEGDDERVNFALNNCAKVGLKPKLYYGSAGYKMDQQLLIELGCELNPNDKGSAGCALTYKRFFQYIVDNYKDGDKILINEDDVIYYENFVEIFPLVWNEVPNDMEVLFIGHCCLNADNSRYVIPGFPKTTHCWIVTPEACRKFLTLYPVKEHIDNVMFDAYHSGKIKIKSYACWHKNHTSPKQYGALGVYFRGFAYQEQADIPLAINKKYVPPKIEYPSYSKLFLTILKLFHMKSDLLILNLADEKLNILLGENITRFDSQIHNNVKLSFYDIVISYQSIDIPCSLQIVIKDDAITVINNP